MVYYSKDGILRFPTGITISKEKNKDGKFKEWDYKSVFIKPTVPDYQLRKDKLDFWLKKANDILSSKYSEGHVLTAAELKTLLMSEEAANEITRTAELVKMYEQFWERKKQYFHSRGKPISLKDYTSLKHMLYDYEAVKGRTLKIKEVDRFFLEDLLNWMRQPNPERIGDYEFKTAGAQNPKTCQKRFAVFLQYFVFLKDLKIVDQSIVDMIRRFTAKEIRVVRTHKVTLTVSEVHKLYEYEFGNQRLNNIRDLFVFTCFTGLRWADLNNFDSRFIKTSADGSGKVYKRKAIKTADSSGASYEIPLCNIALKILHRHGNSLKPLLISNTKTNEYIKEALQITGYFNDISEVVDKETKEYKRRYEAITIHKGRDTFISNLVQTTPLNEVMKYTGHTKLSTLQEYIDQSRQVSMNYIKIFNKQ